MIHTKDRVIDGQTWSVVQLPARRALRTLNRLGRALGPALAQALGAGGTDASVGALGGAVESLFERLTDDELDSLTETLLKDLCRVDGKELWPQFDAVFQGRMLTLLKVLAFAVEVNYSDFFGALLAIASRQAKPVAPTSISDPNS